MTDNNQKVVICPDCEAKIVLTSENEVGDVVDCPDCGTEIEILSLNPLKYAELVEEK